MSKHFQMVGIKTKSKMRSEDRSTNSSRKVSSVMGDPNDNDFVLLLTDKCPADCAAFLGGCVSLLIWQASVQVIAPMTHRLCSTLVSALDLMTCLRSARSALCEVRLSFGRAARDSLEFRRHAEHTLKNRNTRQFSFRPVESLAMAALSQLVLLARSSPRRLTVSNSHCFFPTSLLQAPSRRCAASLVNRGEGMQFSRHLVDRRRIYVTGGHGGSGGLVYTRHTKCLA
ncbi:unnamed protein product [Polarella glacialis]|uniref:Uncharacterized protein n=1 Tax=Polarella glacialis TaxID=89957 RepID=A0A813LLE5_POLGL|nr:unnamed protein product [Polarella glacialis]